MKKKTFKSLPDIYLSTVVVLLLGRSQGQFLTAWTQFLSSGATLTTLIPISFHQYYSTSGNSTFPNLCFIITTRSLCTCIYWQCTPPPPGQIVGRDLTIPPVLYCRYRTQISYQHSILVEIQFVISYHLIWNSGQCHQMKCLHVDKSKRKGEVGYAQWNCLFIDTTG